MLIKRLRQQQRGDTIVEVMIVLAVLGLAIGISYATANRSLLNTRQAQENSMATAAAQSQVEQIISIGCTSGSPACDIHNSGSPGYNLLHPPGTPFCIYNKQVIATNSGPNTVNPNCQVSSLPGSKIEISCLNGCAAPRVFETKISWDDVLGQGTDTVTQDYTLPDTTVSAAAKCPTGQVGTPPHCYAPCPSGQIGTPPVCYPPTCPTGQIGTQPHCQVPKKYKYSISNKVCGTPVGFWGIFSQYSATVNISGGTPGDIVDIQDARVIQPIIWGLGDYGPQTYYRDLGTVTIGSDGKASMNINGGIVFSIKSWALAISDGATTYAPVGLCP